MNIVILNGTPDLRFPEFVSYLQKYQVMLHHLGFYVKTFELSSISIADSVRNEMAFGESHAKNSLYYILSSVKEADLLVFASPLINGRFSDQILNIQQGISGYFGLIEPEQSVPQHRQSIALPAFGVITTTNTDSDHRNVLLNRLSQERTAASLRTLLSFFIIMGATHTEAVFETLQSLKKQKAVREYIQ